MKKYLVWEIVRWPGGLRKTISTKPPKRIITTLFGGKQSWTEKTKGNNTKRDTIKMRWAFIQSCCCWWQSYETNVHCNEAHIPSTVPSWENWGNDGIDAWRWQIKMSLHEAVTKLPELWAKLARSSVTTKSCSPVTFTEYDKGYNMARKIQW